jgi:cell division protein ZapA (FtsZ GTPase activity inhibitor)
VTLEIAGTKFRLVADADAQHLNELAALVNDRVAKLSGTGRPASAAQLLALVALGLADELSTCEKKLREIEQLTRTTIQSVITRIDSRLAVGSVGAQGDLQDDAADADEASHSQAAPHDEAGEPAEREEHDELAQLSLPGAREQAPRNHGDSSRKPRARDERDRSS